MDYFFVGVDVSQDTLDIAYWDDSLKQSFPLSTVYSNDLKGIDQLVDHLKKISHQRDLWICFEHTGAYHLLLAQQLNSLKISYSVVPALEIKRSLGITRGKNDKIDAIRIAEYASRNRIKLKKSEPKHHKLQIISSLLSTRNLLVKNNTACKNHLKSLIKINETTPVHRSIESMKSQIQIMKKDVLKIEKEIKQIIHSCAELKNTFSKITSIPGIGLLTASTAMVHSDNFKNFQCARKFNSYCGLAPFEHRSGTSIRGKSRTSKLRNKELKRLFFTAALTSIRCDQQIKKYYQRKLKEGKHKMSVRNAVASKLVARMFAVVNRDEPYVKLTY